MGDMKTAAYICKGCGIGDRLDADQLEKIASGDGTMGLVRQHDYLCSAAGVELIQNDINNEGVNHIALAACSRRAKTEAFNFDDVAMTRANLREGVIWTQPDTDERKEVTQEMADDYVRMACAEVKSMTPPEASIDRGCNKRIMVVGGGISGMTATIEAANAGYEVLLVEKEGQLGGWAGKLYKKVPSIPPYAEAEYTGVKDIASRIDMHTNITVFLNSIVSRTSGAPGQFTVDISAEGGSISTENIGAIVQASGFTKYDANNLPHLGYSQSADVLDQAELEELVKAADGGEITRPSDGKPISSVVFVQCAGQRSEKDGELSYCSGHCCSTSIKQATYFKDANPDVDTVVIYSDLRTPGKGEDYYRAAQHKQVIFTKGSVSEVSQAGDQLEVKFHDMILNDDAVAQADLVVLATGMVPNSGVDIDAVVSLSDDEDDGSSFVKVAVPSILNLDYRQGVDVPHLKSGFSDSHFICFPYETRRTGIYTCGPVRRPGDILQSTEDATGAAMKAIQAVENASLGRAAHPRSGDLSFPSFRKEGCTQCKRCTVECPFGAINEDEQRYPQFNESRCRRCGTCMGACPVRVISFENYSIDTVGSQIKAVDMPEEADEKPRILILACENDAYPALDQAGANRVEYDAFVRVIPIRCLGSINLIWITDALIAGYDGVMMMGCKKGVDYQCHMVRGSELAHERMSKVGDTLENLQLEPERVQAFEVEITDVDRAPQLINKFAEEMGAIGANPFKDF
jgi:quinone-modifying oxidoreductase subunit QmoB